MMKYLIIYILVFLFLYVTVGFIAGTMQIDTWPWQGRFGMVSVTAIITFVLFWFDIVE